MTQEELQLTIEHILIDDDLAQIPADFSAMSIVSLINRYVAEVIGEDGEPAVNLSQAFEVECRERLRAEQRKRAGISQA